MRLRLPSRAAATATALALALATLLTPPPAAAQFLPPDLDALINKTKIQKKRIGFVIQRADGTLLAAHNADTAYAPASAIKIITGMAALDLLGADFTFKTSIAAAGKITDGTLNGDLHIIGGGDPYITADNLYQIAARLRARGLHTIAGDLVIDDTLFTLPPHDPGAFDGRETQPYNVAPAGVMLNFKTQQIVIAPQDGAINVHTFPPNDHFIIQNRLKKSARRCRNWRGRIRERLTGDDHRVTLRLTGAYPTRCGRQSFYLSTLNHAAHAAGLFGGVWRQLGGKWDGDWRTGATPKNARKLHVHSSPPLPVILQAMNKHSNNLIARSLHLMLASTDGTPPPYTRPRARDAMRGWLHTRGAPGVRIDNGSGLSRTSRITPSQMTHLLDVIHRHPYRAELIASLPILGVDGTLKTRMRRTDSAGEAHLKTGSLRDVIAISGFVRGADGAPLLFTLFAAGQRTRTVHHLQKTLIQWARRH